MHRDIKPANLIVGERGGLRILDFGVAKLAEAEVTCDAPGPGTVAYMSPEQTRGGPVDARTDVWSVGVVLYEMLTGVRPFPATEDPALLQAIEHGRPVPIRQLRPDVPEAVQQLVDRCPRKAPEERYAHGGELRTELQALQTGVGPAPVRSWPRRTAAAGFGALVFAVTVFTGLWVGGRTDWIARPDPAPPAISAASLAVLPFANLRPDPGTDFLGAALAEAIISRIGRTDGVILRPSSAVRRYQGRAIDLQETAAALDVDYLLTGSYLKDGNTLRVSFDLVNTVTRASEWQEAIETAYEDVFRLQDLVATRVVQRMGVGATVQARVSRGRRADVNPAAYELYLRALGYPLLTAEGNRAALALLRRATELDPTYAPAFTARGYRAYALGAYLTDTRQRELAEAEWAFETALSLDARDWQALSYQALLFIAAGRLEAALAPLRQALSIQSHAADAHISLGHVYRLTGLVEESVRSFERARLLDPTNRRLSSAGAAYHYLGRYDEALDALALSPYEPSSLFHQGYLLLESGRAELARERFEAVLTGSAAGPLFTRCAEAYLAYMDGERDRGIALVRDLERHASEVGTDGEAWYGMARLYALFGEGLAAVRMFEGAVDRGYFPYSFIAADPFMASVRDEPAFQNVLARARARHEAFRALVASEGLPR